MSNQCEDGWHPECSECGCGNLCAGAITLCNDCKKKYILRKELLEKIEKEFFDVPVACNNYEEQRQTEYTKREIYDWLLCFLQEKRGDEK